MRKQILVALLLLAVSAVASSVLTSCAGCPCHKQTVKYPG